MCLKLKKIHSLKLIHISNRKKHDEKIRYLPTKFLLTGSMCDAIAHNFINGPHAMPNITSPPPTFAFIATLSMAASCTGN